MSGELTIYPDLEQGSEEWFDQRRGMVTASVVGQLVAASAPDPLTVDCPTCGASPDHQCLSMTRKEPTRIKTVHATRSAAISDAPPVIGAVDNDTSRGLTSLLVAERITGWSESTFVNADMFRGVLCEPIARAAYSKHHAPVTEMGFMRWDGDGWALGCSPDGLVGDDGMIEIKAPRAKAHVRTILADEVPAQYIAQCQASLLVSGRDWLDFVSFYGGLPLYTKRVVPDPDWHAAIRSACQMFELNAQAMAADYERRVTGLPMTERVDLDMEIVI